MGSFAMGLKKLLIVDGYNDEPGGLGVPPYIDVYPRYIAGALWSVDKSIRVDYVDVDRFRENKNWLYRASLYDAVVFIAGVVVPGRYIGARPAEPEELIMWAKIIDGPLKILAGPAAKWGLGVRGGSIAYPPWKFKREGFNVLVTGDVEEYFLDLALYGAEKADPGRVREDYSIVDKVAPLGARIVKRHPSYGRNLVAEIETYRGCARWVSGGCSFCVEPLRGRPIQRRPEAIAREVEALYRAGVLHFRLGRQADILVYGSPALDSEEWPPPNPRELEKLFTGVRSAAPGLRVLHIDNVNPGTIVRYPVASEKALKVIVKLHTPGDVAAMGLETADPKVARINNLNTHPEDVLEAVRIVNRVGAVRGWNGMPHLLPGINFILGLPGERSETYRLNREFLETLLNERLLVRRVNVRRILVLPVARAYRMGAGIGGRREKLASSFVKWVRSVFDPKMLSMVAPRDTVLRGLWVEECVDSICYSRQPGSYPLIAAVRCRLPRGTFLDRVLVTGVHSGRSVEAVPIPLSRHSKKNIVEAVANLEGLTGEKGWMCS
ncbi:radical SAM protein [Aeropyrum pernix]|nr:radical SAM protein [Aeropyrum pernix]